MIHQFQRRTSLDGQSVMQCYLQCISSHRSVGLLPVGMTSNHTKFEKKEFTKQDECVMGTPSGDSTHSSRGHVSGATCGAPGN